MLDTSSRLLIEKPAPFFNLAFYCPTFIKCCGPTSKTYQIQNIPFSTQNIFFLIRKYYHIWHTKHHCQQNKSVVAMLPCVVCSFKAISEKHLRMHMQTSMMIVWEPVRSVTNLAKEGGSLRRTWILTGKVAANTVERRSHTIVQPVMWQSVLERSNSNVKIALLSLTQRGIWKCMWPAKVVQCSATVVTKPWKTQVIWTDTLL